MKRYKQRITDHKRVTATFEQVLKGLVGIAWNESLVQAENSTFRDMVW